jgi:hypothetical protein
MVVSTDRLSTDELGKKIGAVWSPKALGVVIWWEFRRYVARPANLIVALGAFVLMVLLFRSLHSQAVLLFGAPPGPFTQIVIPFAAIGITAIVFPYAMQYVGLFLPFINADVVSTDLRRRTHAVLMATALPTWAYVWGRYLYGLILSIGLAALILPAYVLASFMSDSSLAELNFGGMLTIWAVNVLCPVIFLSGLGFALGTMLPRYANLIKVVLLLGWITTFIVLAQFELHSREGWDPSGEAWVHLHVSKPLYQSIDHGTAALYAQAHVIPALSSVVGPHLALALIGIGAALIAALSFNRFRTATV